MNGWWELGAAVVGLSLFAYFHVAAAMETWCLARGLWELRRPRAERAHAKTGMLWLFAVRAPFCWAMLGGIWWSVLRGRAGA